MKYWHRKCLIIVSCTFFAHFYRLVSRPRNADWALSGEKQPCDRQQLLCRQPHDMPVGWHDKPHADFRGHAVLWTAQDDPLSPGVLSSNYRFYRKGGKRTSGRPLLQFTRNPSVPGVSFLSMLGVTKLHLEKTKETVPHQLCLSPLQWWRQSCHTIVSIHDMYENGRINGPILITLNFQKSYLSF